MRLEKEKRIGTGPDGFEKLKKHEFFRGIDFSTLLDQTPPLSGEGTADSEINYARIQPGAKLEIEAEYFSCESSAEPNPSVKEGSHHGITADR